MIAREAPLRRSDARADGRLRGAGGAPCAAEARGTSPPARTSSSTTSPSLACHRRCCGMLAASTGLSTREACGNTVRNVTADPWAGVTRGRTLRRDTVRRRIRPRFWLRNPLTQLLPQQVQGRVLSADDADVAITGIHDLGFIPRIQVIDGKEVQRLQDGDCGGGLAIMPKRGDRGARVRVRWTSTCETERGGASASSTAADMAAEESSPWRDIKVLIQTASARRGASSRWWMRS